MAAKRKRKTTTKKKPVEKPKSHSVSPLVLGLLSVIVFSAVLYFAYTHYSTPSQEELAAIVNGEYITKDELARQYAFLPPFMQESLTEATFLPLLIDQTVLTQEARNNGYSATDSEAYEFIRHSIIASGLTEEDFFKTLTENDGPSKDELMHHYRTQIAINKLLNATVMSKIEITDDMVQQFYDANAFLNTETQEKRPLEDVRESIEAQLRAQASQDAYTGFIQKVREKAQVTIYLTEEKEISSFKMTQDPLCPSDDVPFVFFYGSSGCEYCKSIEEPFKNAIKDAVALKQINAYYYHLDTQDDLFTETVETQLPQGHLGLFEYYSPEQQVPLIVFGCRYSRLGAGTGDPILEEAEFRKMLNLILDEHERRQG